MIATFDSLRSQYEDFARRDDRVLVKAPSAKVFSISDDMPESGGGGTGVTFGVEVAASDDDDGGESDGEPARQTRKTSKSSILKVGATRRSLSQPITSNDAGNNMTILNSGKHRNVTATVDALSIPQTQTIALLRVNKVLELIPISKSGWWAGVASGRYPKPVKLSTRCVAWRSQDIAALIASF